MPRAGRIVMDNGIYHVLTRGNNGQMTFHERADYQRYLQLLSTYAKQHRLGVYHFALMPNHVHLILHVGVAEGLSKAMLGLNLTYALFYQRRYRHQGHLWQGRFKSFLIDHDNYLLACGRYIELNPVRARLAAQPGDYPWSSYRFYAEGADNPLLSPDPLYETLCRSANERQSRYRQFVHEGLREEPLRSLRAFEERFGVRRARRRVGRPKKTPPETLALSNKH